MIETLTQFTGYLSDLLWKNPLTLVLLLGTGAYLTVRLGFVQVRAFGHALQLVRGRHIDPNEAGEVTPFQALSTSLSATVGTGNIAGVATAISLGGPGALFWMWITALVGMATRFAEATLAIRYREVTPTGEIGGGPMYSLLNGLNMRRTAIAFAIFAMIASFGIGNMVQANSVVGGLGRAFPNMLDHRAAIGLVMAICVGMVIVGGVKRIARVASMLVPFMAVMYVAGAMFVLLQHTDTLAETMRLIVNSALNPSAVGGAVIGEAIRWGVARGLFSNEAGLGSSPMAYAATRTSEPVRGGLVSMLGPFVDTIIICSMTGFVIIITGAWQSAPEGIEGAALTAYAFSQDLNRAGAWVVGLGLSLFAFSTTIAWSYYGDRSARFLFGARAVLPYRMLYTVLVFVGAVFPLQLVWNLADITNLLMAVPNLICLWLLSGVLSSMKTDYFERRRRTR
jgi:AGCS family alanine or glycine:cation symporter